MDVEDDFGERLPDCFAGGLTFFADEERRDLTVGFTRDEPEDGFVERLVEGLDEARAVLVERDWRVLVVVV